VRPVPVTGAGFLAHRAPGVRSARASPTDRTSAGEVRARWLGRGAEPGLDDQACVWLVGLVAHPDGDGDGAERAMSDVSDCEPDRRQPSSAQRSRTEPCGAEVLRSDPSAAYSWTIGPLDT
jgi:hypothetical protein